MKQDEMLRSKRNCKELFIDLEFLRIEEDLEPEIQPISPHVALKVFHLCGLKPTQVAK